MNATGDAVVMVVRACDPVGCAPTTRDVRITIVGDNAVPTLARTDLKLGLDTGFTNAGTLQNTPVQITHETLRTASGANDSDLTPLWFRIQTLESGKLTVTTFNGTPLLSVDFRSPSAISDLSKLYSVKPLPISS